MVRDPSGGGFSLFGAPWWVAVIGLVVAFAAVGIARIWWHARMTHVVRKAAREHRRNEKSASS